MKNNLTLLVDANWLLISRASVLIKSFQSNLSTVAKQQSQSELEDLLAKSICVILNKIPIIDNIVIVADGGSWRKQLPIPHCIEGTTYKGNRTKTEDTDWDYIYKALSNVLERAKNEGITVSQYNNIEGDDWVWYWSRRLNCDDVNCIIWSSDNDLKQLLQIDKNTNAFTAWYNDKNGLWLPDSIKMPDDPVEFFMSTEYFSPILESIKRNIEVNYINPDTIINSKVICGDAGDNIMPVFRYKKGSRTFRITEKIWGEISNELNIKTIYDLTDKWDEVANRICSHSKFAIHSPNRELIREMIDYNRKLVWLNELVIPDTAIQAMNQQEYQLFDVPYIRNNYKSLLKTNDDIQSLFESI
jgi:hypothetical protein